MTIDSDSFFNQLRELINNTPIGVIISRKEILFKIKGRRSQFTLDTYRMTLTKLNYLKKVGAGKYKVIHHIPEDKSMKELHELAYSNEFLVERLFHDMEIINAEELRNESSK